MAGGEGTRLHPLSLGMPKPMVPLLGRPVMEHIIGLLKRHGIDEIAVTLCYMPEAVQSYFGDGQKWGVRLHYFIEEAPLGTAGSVRACAPFLEGEDFLVISGDSVCDLDLTAAMEFHQAKRAQATLVLFRHPAPLEYGLVLTDEEQRVVRFVEKPSWGQVVTDLVNTGIYLLSPQVLEQIPPDRPWDFGKDVFPALLESGGGLYGVPGGGYWCDMGDCGAYLDCAADALSGKVKLDMGLPQQSPGVWSAQPIPEGVTVIPPCWLGPGAAVEPGALIGPHTVLEQNSWVGRRSLVQRSVLLPGARAEERTTLYGAILCKGAAARPEAVLNEGTVLGERALAEEKAVLLEGVRLWPARVAPAGTRLSRSITSSGRREPLLFGDGGVIRGVLGEDLGPEALMTIGGVLGCEGKVGLGYWGGNGARMLAQAAASGIAAAGGTPLAHDLECAAQAAWLAEHHQIPVSLFLEQEGDRIYLHLFGRSGLPLGRARERKLEHAVAQGDAPRVPAGQIGEVVRVHAGCDDYAADAARRSRLHRFPMRSITVAVPGSAPADRAIRQALSSLGCTVLDRWRKGVPAFSGLHGGLYLSAQDESGTLLDPGQLLTLVCLIEMEDGGGRVAVPDGASAAVDLVAAGFHGTALRLGRDGEQALSLYAALPWLRDAACAAARICSRMGSSGEKLEALMSKTPRFSSWKREVPLHGNRGLLMQTLAEGKAAAGGEGVRIHTGNGWVYLVPLSRRPALRILAESPDLEVAAELCDFYAGRAAQLDRELSRQLSPSEQREGPAGEQL